MKKKKLIYSMASVACWFLVVLSSAGCSSVEIKKNTLSLEELKQYLVDIQENKYGIMMHKDLECMGFRNGPEIEPYILLNIKDVESMKALLELGYLVDTVWFKEDKRVLNTILYYNPYSKEIMVLTAFFEDSSDSISPPFKLTQLPKNYRLLLSGIFLIYTVKASPNRELYESCQ